MNSSPKAPEALRELLDELAVIEDRELRSQLLIEYGERFQTVSTEIAAPPYPEANKVPACESDAYLFPRVREDGTLNFHFAVENPQGISAMAFAVILDETLSGAPLDEILQVSDEIVYDIFGRSISMGKGLGLRSMIRMVKAFAEQQRCRE